MQRNERVSNDPSRYVRQTTNFFQKLNNKKKGVYWKMHCKHNIGKVMKLHDDTITSYTGYSKRNFKKCHLTSLGRVSVKH